MSRTLKLTALIVAIGLVPLLIVGVLIAQRGSDHAAVDSALVSRANVQATELEAGFARGRTIALLMSSNPSFGDFYAQPGSRTEKIAAQGPTIDRVHRALSYLETLYPGQIGEVCFIDASGVENARVVRGTKALPSELSDESKNAFFKPSFEERLGGVYQSPPYVSPDTNEWVIGTTTPISGPSGAVAGIVHFELTIDSFRTASSASAVATLAALRGEDVAGFPRPSRTSWPASGCRLRTRPLAVRGAGRDWPTAQEAALKRARACICPPRRISWTSFCTAISPPSTRTFAASCARARAEPPRVLRRLSRRWVSSAAT